MEFERYQATNNYVRVWTSANRQAVVIFGGILHYCSSDKLHI